MSPEYATTGSIHSYISSSDDECVGRIITLPVFSVTQSITDIHNTCVCALWFVRIRSFAYAITDIGMGFRSLY